MMRKNSGFTLIEIAVVLVVIGLLLGALLKTTGIIGNTKTTSTVSFIKDLSGAVATFKGRYHYLPGDLPSASDDIQSISGSCNIAASTTNIGNGLIDTQTEIDCASQELILAELVKGDQTAKGFISPLNDGSIPDAFLMAKSKASVATFPATTSNVIEIQNISCEAVNAIDSKIDDGDTTTGNVRSNPACTAGVSTATLDVAL